MATLREQAKTSIPRVLRNSLSHGNNSFGKLDGRSMNQLIDDNYFQRLKESSLRGSSSMLSPRP